jgi:hypothetical protein
MEELVQERELGVGVGALSCRSKVFVAPPAVALSVAVELELTADTVAVKPALVAPEATVTEAGTVTEVLVLDSVTAWPPVGAAAVRVTVHGSVPAPVMEELVQERELGVGVGALSCRSKVFAAPPAVALSVAVELELTADTVAVKPALVAPEATVTEAGTATELLVLDSDTVSPPDGAAPVRVTVHGSVPAPVIEELVQERELGVGVGALSCTAKVLVAPPAVALNVAV